MEKNQFWGCQAWKRPKNLTFFNSFKNQTLHFWMFFQKSFRNELSRPFYPILIPNTPYVKTYIEKNTYIWHFQAWVAWIEKGKKPQGVYMRRVKYPSITPPHLYTPLLLCIRYCFSGWRNYQTTRTLMWSTSSCTIRRWNTSKTTPQVQGVMHP